jgi:hypothetical protein
MSEAERKKTVPRARVHFVKPKQVPESEMPQLNAQGYRKASIYREAPLGLWNRDKL